MLRYSRNLQPNRLGEAAIVASRQMWLASLGAAVVTRDWVQTEASDVFKALIKEGTVVESQAVRFVGDRLETSFSAANSVWKETRRTVESTVKQAADAAVSFAQQVLPRSLPEFELPRPLKARRTVTHAPTKANRMEKAKRVEKAKRMEKAKRVVKTARKAKRTGRAATKRA